MDKAKSVREALAAVVPGLVENPERLLVFADKGNVIATAVPGLSFEYRYTLNVIITDFAQDPDVVMVALVGWMKRHQVDALMDPDKRGQAITFEADIISADAVDLSIKLQLTEAVGVTPRPGGGVDVAHHAEPNPMPDSPFPGGIELYANGELIGVLGTLNQ